MKASGRKMGDPFWAPGTPVKNNPDNANLLQELGGKMGPSGPQITMATYYKDSIATLPGAPAFMTQPMQSNIGMEPPTPKGIGDLPGTQLPIGHPGGGALGRLEQRGMSTSPSMLPGSGPRRNEPRPGRP